MKHIDGTDWVLSAFIVIAPLVVILAITTHKPEVTEPQQKCEAAGGIFFDGKFGADNCVFPPKDRS